jgi:hypothetical protein
VVADRDFAIVPAGYPSPPCDPPQVVESFVDD